MSQTIAAAPASLGGADFPLTFEQFEQARALFKQAALERRLTAASMCAWNILRGADARRGFSPITNERKLANGASPWGAFSIAEHLAETASPEALAPWEPLLLEAGCQRSMWRWEGEHPILAALSARRRSR